MSEISTQDVTATVDTYLAAWSEPDAVRRAELVEQVWTPDGRLVDPPLEGIGHAGIADLGVALQTHYPGHTFRRTSGVDAHHDQLRFTWELVGPDDAVALTGLDVGEVAPNGRLHRIAGFFGDVPELGNA